MRLTTPILAAALVLSSSVHAEEMIEISNSLAGLFPVSEALAKGAGYKGNEKEVSEAAHEQIESSEVLDATLKATLHESVDEILGQRWFDIELAFLSGIPDVIGICIEGHPIRHFAIEACASTAILAAAVSANVKYRWDLVVHQSANGNVHQLSAGPGFGMHGIWATSAFGSSSGPTLTSYTIDAMGSLEYVYWITKHFGITAQLDIGASYVFYVGGDRDPQFAPTPTGRLTFGFAF